MKGVKIGVIFLIMGIAIAGVFYFIEQEQEKAVYEKRMESLSKRYPPGTYRPPEFADILLAPIPPRARELALTLD